MTGSVVVVLALLVKIVVLELDDPEAQGFVRRLLVVAISPVDRKSLKRVALLVSGLMLRRDSRTRVAMQDLPNVKILPSFDIGDWRVKGGD